MRPNERAGKRGREYVGGWEGKEERAREGYSAGGGSVVRMRLARPTEMVTAPGGRGGLSFLANGVWSANVSSRSSMSNL